MYCIPLDCNLVLLHIYLYNAVYKKVKDMLNVSAPSRTPIFRGNRRDPGGLPMITNGGKQDKETGLTVWNEHYPFGKKLDNLTSSFYITCMCTSLSKFKWQLKYVYDRMKKNQWASQCCMWNIWITSYRSCFCDIKSNLMKILSWFMGNILCHSYTCVVYMLYQY